MWNLLYNLDVKPWNLHAEPLRGTLVWRFLPKPSCETFLQSVYVKPWCGTSGLQEPESFCGSVLTWEPFICGIWELIRVEPFIWNVGKPEPLCGTEEHLRVEPACGTLGNLVPGFERLPQTTPKLYWKNPKLFKLLGKKKLRSPPEQPALLPYVDFCYNCQACLDGQPERWRHGWRSTETESFLELCVFVKTRSVYYVYVYVCVYVYVYEFRSWIMRKIIAVLCFAFAKRKLH